MNVKQVQNLCAKFPGAMVKLHEDPSNVLVYSVGGKFFAYFKTSEPERWRFSFRVTPDRFLELTDRPGIKPARYMGRFHWITVVSVQTMPTKYLRELVEWSYRRAVESLSKGKQAKLHAVLSV